MLSHCSYLFSLSGLVKDWTLALALPTCNFSSTTLLLFINLADNSQRQLTCLLSSLIFLHCLLRCNPSQINSFCYPSCLVLFLTTLHFFMILLPHICCFYFICQSFKSELITFLLIFIFATKICCFDLFLMTLILLITFVTSLVATLSILLEGLSYHASILALTLGLNSNCLEFGLCSNSVLQVDFTHKNRY